MLKRDFIMVQIEEIGKAIALLFFNRKEGKGADENPTILSNAYLALKIDSPFLLQHTPQEIVEVLNQDDGCGMQRLELAAKLLLEESYLSTFPLPLLEKAQELFYYLQIHDSTYSLERVKLLQDIEFEINYRKISKT